MSKNIVIMSLKGGTGRSTIAANLATVLGRGGQQCMVYDLDPQNAVGGHFGMHAGDTSGLATSQATLQRVRDLTQRNPVRVPYVPYGRPNEEQLEAFEQELARDPQWLRKTVVNATPEDTTMVLFDTPPGRSALLKQALAMADFVLVVLTPDAGSFATIPATEALIERNVPAGPRSRGWSILVNQADARSALSRDVSAAIAQSFPTRALPMTVPFDESVKEAFARQRTLLEDAPGSQALEVLWAVGEWVATRWERRGDSRDLSPVLNVN